MIVVHLSVDIADCVLTLPLAVLRAAPCSALLCSALLCSAVFLVVGDKVDFSAEETKVLNRWEDISAFETSLKQSEGKPIYTFYDGTRRRSTRHAHSSARGRLALTCVVSSLLCWCV